MAQIVSCSIIICDDFNAVLIANRGKGKKGLQNPWSIFSRDMKGKETTEQCIIKAIDKYLQCTLFDLTIFKEYALDKDSGDTSLIYTGKVKEYLTPHKEINKIKWITERELDQYEFSGTEKEILLDFFKSKK